MASTRSSSRRARQLPWDVLVLVFQLSDDPTLAVFGRVSLDVSVATSSILYKYIDIKSLKQLGKLFRERKQRKNASKPSRISPHLSLTQFHTLIINLTDDAAVLDLEFDLDPEDYEGVAPPTLDFSRISYRDPLPIHSVQLAYAEQNCDPLVQFLHSHFLPHLNPTRCAHKRTTDRGYELWTCISDACPLASWTRLRTLRLDGTVPYIFRQPRSVEETQFKFKIGFLSRERFGDLDRIEIVLASFEDLYTPDREDPGLYLLKELDLKGNFFGAEDLKDGTIVLEVGSEEERVAVEKAVAALVRTKEKFQVVLVQ